jgi:hypothetical protein
MNYEQGYYVCERRGPSCGEEQYNHAQEELKAEYSHGDSGIVRLDGSSQLCGLPDLSEDTSDGPAEKGRLET